MADYTNVPPKGAVSPFKGLRAEHAPRCTETVPESLSLGLRPLPRCKLPMSPHGRPHTGSHSASWTLVGTGKVQFRWKSQRQADRFNAALVRVNQKQLRTPL